MNPREITQYSQKKMHKKAKNVEKKNLYILYIAKNDFSFSYTYHPKEREQLKKLMNYA